MLGAHAYMGNQGQITAATFQLDSASSVHRTVRTLYSIPRLLHNMTATNTEKVAAVVQHQNVQHRFVLLHVLRDCYFAVIDLSIRCSTLLKPIVVANGVVDEARL